MYDKDSTFGRFESKEKKKHKQLRVNSKVCNYKKYIFVTHAPCKKKSRVWQSWKGKNRELRMKVQTYVNKRLVTDKRTFYCTHAMKEIPNFGNH